MDAYEGEGWRGANREKVRSDADLEHARMQVRAPEQAAMHAERGVIRLPLMKAVSLSQVALQASWAHRR